MSKFERPIAKRAAVTSLLTLAIALPTWAWGPQGHRLVALIAAAHLTASARGHVAELLGVDPADADALADAMADASTWADEIKHVAEGSGTGNWHFLDLADSDGKNEIAGRCPGGDCITAKLPELRQALEAGQGFHFQNHDYAPVDVLRFIIHFMGDLHQPLHCATNADAGGNCLHTKGFGAAELHAAWDGGLVKRLFSTGSGGTSSEAELARNLNKRFAARRKLYVGTTDLEVIAIESHSIGFESAYGPLLHLLPGDEPRAFLIVPVSSCKGAEDLKHLTPAIDLTEVYTDETFDTVSEQIAKAGYRLAALLNTAFSKSNGRQ